MSPTSDRFHSDPEFIPRLRRLRNRAVRPLMETGPSRLGAQSPLCLGTRRCPLPGPQRHRAWRKREAEAFGVESGGLHPSPRLLEPPRVPGLLASAQHFSGSFLRQEMGFVLPKPQRSRGASADPLGSPSEPTVAQRVPLTPPPLRPAAGLALGTQWRKVGFQTFLPPSPLLCWSTDVGAAPQRAPSFASTPHPRAVCPRCPSPGAAPSGRPWLSS